MDILRKNKDKISFFDSKFFKYSERVSEFRSYTFTDLIERTDRLKFLEPNW